MNMRFNKTSSNAFAHPFAAGRYPSHDFPRGWTALDLVDALPLRLSERMSLGLVRFASAPGSANNPFAPAGKRACFRRGYAAGSELTSFRVR